MVELMIAIAVSSTVMLAVIALLGYGSRSLNLTQAKVALQDQAKDAINHISSYCMEASEVEWDTGHKVLTVKKDKIKNEGEAEAKVESVDTYLYWFQGEAVYFASLADLAAAEGVEPSEFSFSSLTADKKHLLADKVKNFECEITEDEKTKRKILHVQMKMKDEISEFSCEKDIFMRNQ